MYKKEFFEERFALTNLQADDYLKAFYCIQNLLQQTNPLNKALHRRDYYYDEEALSLLESVHQMGNNLQIPALLKAAFPSFAKRRSEEADYVARRLLSIRDSYIWPAYTYDDWEKYQKKSTNKCRMSRDVLYPVARKVLRPHR